MDIDSFIAKYGPEWARLEEACSGGSQGLARLPGPQISEIVRLYLRASAHLAEVQTRYHDRRLQEYLTRVVTRAQAAVYGARPRTLAGGARLFGARYREAIARTAPHIVVAAALFLTLVLIVDLWVANSAEARAGLLPGFARDAVRRAGADLRSPSASISTFILLNNVQVAFLAFALGISAGVGTIFVLVQNGLLIGMLAGAFQAAGKAGTFWALVLPHGFLEITAISIAAGAGLRMGWSIVAPGDRSRSEALAEEARDAVMVVLGVIPAFAVAAAIEGFVTGTAVPDPLELGLGAAVTVAYIAFLFGRPRLRGARRP